MSEPASKWVALLKGINVGGHNKVPMAELRDLCADLGWQDVQTYIASGNLVFRAAGEGAELAEALRQKMIASLDVDVPILALPAWMLGMLADQCPFDPVDGKHVHIFFLWDEPEVDWNLCNDLRTDTEALEIDGRIAWLHTPDGFGRSKLADKLGRVFNDTEMTGRNLNTLRKLVEMSS